jgi:hypothetical protein
MNIICAPKPARQQRLALLRRVVLAACHIAVGKREISLHLLVAVAPLFHNMIHWGVSLDDRNRILLAPRRFKSEVPNANIGVKFDKNDCNGQSVTILRLKWLHNCETDTPQMVAYS